MSDEAMIDHEEIAETTAKNSISDDVVEYILSCPAEDLESISVGSLAKKFNVNRSHLSQRFKSDKKFTLHDYIVMVKVLRALSLLESEETITIDDLSRKMGFSSTDYFTGIFKKIIGTTPGKYKKCYQSINPPAKNVKKGKKK